MSIGERFDRAVKRLLLGSAGFHQQCTIALHEPQSEVSVRLHGLGEPLDVTRTHMLACATPFTIGIGLDHVPAAGSAPLSLAFYESAGEQRLLGEIGLHLRETVTAGGRPLCLLEVRSSRNYCLPRARLWSHYLYYAYKAWRNNPEVRVTSRGRHAMAVFYICPRPVVLVSAGSRETFNMFPMNLMGPIGGGFFAFALTSGRGATVFVDRCRRVALSTIPVEQSGIAYRLAHNHRLDRIDWTQLPFPTRASALFDLPVPQFASRVTEMQVESVREMGSHHLFVAKILHQEECAGGPDFFMVHGVYDVWRKAAWRKLACHNREGV